MKKILLVCSVMVLLANHAAGSNMDVELQGLNLQGHLLGPEVSVPELNGKVVLVEFWGYNCPPCRTSLPKLSDWQTKYENQGLVIIGVHCQNVSDSKVKSLCQEKGVNFSIYSSGHVEGGRDFSGIPHCFLFDHTGKCLFRGSPFDVEATLKKALKDAPPPLMAGLELNHFASVQQELKNGVSPASIMKRLKSKTRSKNEEIAAEASLIIEHLGKQADNSIEKAKELKESDPINCIKLLSKVALGYAGTDYGREAKSLIQKYKRDKAFKSEFAANDLLLKIQMLEKHLKPIRSPQGNDYTSMQFRTRNRVLLQQIAGAVMLMQKKYPDTKSTGKAREIAEKYGLL